MTKRTLGSTVKALREQKGLGVRELAERVGIARSSMAMIELDDRRPSPAVLARLVKVLGAKAEDVKALAAVELPRLAPYLRAKYDMSDDQVAELEAAFEAVRKRPSGKRGSQ